MGPAMTGLSLAHIKTHQLTPRQWIRWDTALCLLFYSPDFAATFVHKMWKCCSHAEVWKRQYTFLCKAN